MEFLAFFVWLHCQGKDALGNSQGSNEQDRCQHKKAEDSMDMDMLHLPADIIPGLQSKNKRKQEYPKARNHVHCLGSVVILLEVAARGQKEVATDSPSEPHPAAVLVEFFAFRHLGLLKAPVSLNPDHEPTLGRQFAVRAAFGVERVRKAKQQVFVVGNREVLLVVCFYVSCCCKN